jgi:hypothetical protein
MTHDAATQPRGVPLSPTRQRHTVVEEVAEPDSEDCDPVQACSTHAGAQIVRPGSFILADPHHRLQRSALLLHVGGVAFQG